VLPPYYLLAPLPVPRFTLVSRKALAGDVMTCTYGGLLFDKHTVRFSDSLMAFTKDSATHWLDANGTGGYGR
jgi:hypothetical protein